ncbi:recombinase family protein [Arcobacter porcinus]|uniref:DNA-invertase from lambdoid prophage Rac n=1 Tax=Arcobacter porcinus TaxID=1935204 RepID=A0A1C0B0P4_9BACT|nr:recombinase family protein [Arcobacter porcinus]OCL91482.1 putative DNA-invertase from lambdoid prophage Rac [Aliarcobacter thereius]OCL82383.1 putative DNA-invertase from lambdoid prophage Rac [Arcobacter porcinus]OCL82625.1 putative DNA-invertase from lambdoid prophage Rac [Arcobacter porcinus]OCL87243.1 putative DNA-invertase from lambdoid prophage Rac [Arcobacter porcinus]OCL93386.1 putative DNA-invertase from lambdoid prophage Rac [Arcobacter porcinus]
MSKVFTYIRGSEAQQDYAQNQKKSIENYILKKRIEVYKEIVIEINRPQEERNLLKLIENCEKNSTLIVANLNVFGRTINAILKIVKYLLSNNIRIVVVEQNLDLLDEKDPLAIMVLNIISVAVNLEKELQSLRTKEALNAKKLDGIALGKPIGTIQKSKFDEHRDKIEELLSMGMSVRKIAKLLGYNNHIGLNNYVKKRDIKEQVLKKQELI